MVDRLWVRESGWGGMQNGWRDGVVGANAISVVHENAFGAIIDTRFNCGQPGTSLT